MLGALYALLAAGSFGFNNASARRGVITGTALQGLVISMPIGLGLFALMALMSGQWQRWGELQPTGIGVLAFAGLVHFIGGRYFNYRALAAVGANIAGPVQQFQLLLSLTLAVVFLGETLTVPKLAGIALIVLAPMVILRRRGPRAPDPAPSERAPAPEFKPRLAEGYGFAVLSSLGFGSSPVLVKIGLEGTGLSLVGGVISYATAAAVVSLVLMRPSKRRQVRATERQALKWFTFSGVGVGVSQMFRYLALGIAPVTVVQPLLSLSLMFRMIFGYFINREHERFDRYVIFGMLLSFCGAVVISLPHHAAEAWTWP